MSVGTSSATNTTTTAHGAFVNAIAGASIGAVLVFGGFAVAIAIRLATNETVPIGVIGALFASFGVGVFARERNPKLVTAAAIGALFALTPILFGGASWALSDPLATTRMRCGTGDVGLPFAGVLAIFVGATVAVPFAVVANVLSSRVPRVFIACAVAITCACAVVAGISIASMGKPDPDHFFDLFERATLEPGGKLSLESASFVYADKADPAPLLGERTCSLQVFRSGKPEEPQRIATNSDTCPRLRVYVDKSSLTSIVTDFSSSHARLIIDNPSPYGADREITIDDIHARLGAPRGWIFGAMLGVLGALASIFLSLRARRKTKAILATIIEAEHDQGWVAIAGHAPRFIPALELAPAGPIVVLERARARTPTYRSDGAADPIVVELGTRASFIATSNTRAAMWACLAITVAIATITPLWVARLHGLL